MTNAETVAHMLTLDRVNWTRIVALGGNIRTIAEEAERHGDTVLARKARRAIERRRA